MSTLAEMQAKVDKLAVNMTRLDSITNGSNTTTVATDGPVVPSVAKFFKDLQDDYNAAGTSPRVQLKNVIVGIGDSYIDPDGGGTTFFGRLEALLGESWATHNFGSGGETSTQVFNRFATQVYDTADARVLYISCGINDIILASATSTELGENSTTRTARMIVARDLVISNLQALYTSAASNSGANKIVAAKLPPIKGSTFVVSPSGVNPGTTQPLWNSDVQSAIDYINTWMVSTATGRTHVLDVYGILDDTGNPGQIKSAYNNDYIHPNTSGYTAMADALYAISGMFTAASSAALLYSTQPADRRPLVFNQSLRTFDSARFSGLALGWASTKFKPLVLRSRDPAVDEEQIAILQRLGTGNDGFLIHASDSGNLVFSRLANGITQASVLTLSGVNTAQSSLLGGAKLVSDTSPLILHTSTFAGAAGQAFSFAVKSTGSGIAAGPGYSATVYGAGPGTLGTFYGTAAEWNFDGVTRIIAQTGGPDLRFARQPSGGGTVADQTRVFHDGINFIIGSTGLMSGVFLPNGNSSWSSLSSAELKERVNDLDAIGASDRLSRLRLVEFYWRDRPGQDRPSRGVIAEEAEQVYPDLVSVGPGGYKGFDYLGVLPDLAAAVKALMLRVDNIEGRL